MDLNSVRESLEDAALRHNGANNIIDTFQENKDPVDKETLDLLGELLWYISQLSTLHLLIRVGKFSISAKGLMMSSI